MQPALYIIFMAIGQLSKFECKIVQTHGTAWPRMKESVILFGYSRAHTWLVQRFIHKFYFYFIFKIRNWRYMNWLMDSKTNRRERTRQQKEKEITFTVYVVWFGREAIGWIYNVPLCFAIREFVYVANKRSRFYFHQIVHERKFIVIVRITLYGISCC